MTIQIFVVILFCVLYFISTISAIMVAGKVNENSEEQETLLNVINSFTFAMMLGFGVGWLNFNGWTWFLMCICLIGCFLPKTERHGSIRMVIFGKLLGILFLYLAGFFNCLM